MGTWLLHWFLSWTGANNPSGVAYGLWSGFLSDIGEVTLIAAAYAWYRRNNCEVTGCPRLARHATAASHHVCRKHHPDAYLSVEDVHAAHNAALRSTQ